MKLAFMLNTTSCSPPKPLYMRGYHTRPNFKRFSLILHFDKRIGKGILNMRTDRLWGPRQSF